MDRLATPLALTAAALFIAGCGGSEKPATNPAVTTDTTVKCLGIHECKGQSQCNVAGGHACAGQNECKGKGWIKVPQSECTAKGGSII